jgi:transcriptional regulator with XRE-family HTH domain
VQEESSQNFTRRLERLKFSKGWTDEQLSSAVGLSRRMLYLARTGKSSITRKTLYKLESAERAEGITNHTKPTHEPLDSKGLVKETSPPYGLPAGIEKDLLDDVYRLENIAHEFTEGLVKIRAKLEQYGKKKERDV